MFLNKLPVVFAGLELMGAMCFGIPILIIALLVLLGLAARKGKELEKQDRFEEIQDTSGKND
jgi:hypothetical protein